MQAHRLPYKSVKLFHEKISEIKGGDFVVMAGESLVAFKEGIAMRTSDHRDAKFCAFGLEQPAGATIGVDHENIVIGGAVFEHAGLDRFCDALWVEVKIGRETGEIHVGPAVLSFERQNFTR